MLVKFLNHRTIYATLFYILVVVLIIVSKPEFAFDSNNNIRAFGIGPNKSIVSLGVVSCVLAILSFYAFTLIDIIFQGKYQMF